jgi:hypothetical protein
MLFVEVTAVCSCNESTNTVRTEKLTQAGGTITTVF